MKKYLLSFILSVAAVVSAKADGYTGVLVTDNEGHETYYLFEEQPTVKYEQVADVMNARLYINGETDPVPVVSVPLQDDATLTVKFETFVRVNLNSAGYATFSAKDVSFIATDGVKAYKASVEGETITLTELTGNIPAGTGVLLYGETAGTKVDLPVAISREAADVTGNVLKATTKDDGTLAAKEDNSWALGTSNQFLKYTGTEYIHNRAYLVHEQSSSSARSMQIVFEGTETTAIDNIVSEATASDGKLLDGGKIVIIKDGKKYNVVGQLIK